MKRVVIVRHAKAVPYGYDADFERELTGRGEKDAKNIGRELNRKVIVPDLMISSPAARALKTAQIFAENLGFDSNQIQKKMAIYDGLTTAGFLSIVHQLPENAKTIFFFGHNPGFHYLVSNLLTSFWGEMPTCSTVGIDFEVESWHEIEVRTGKTAFHLVPKNFH